MIRRKRILLRLPTAPKHRGKKLMKSRLIALGLVVTLAATAWAGTEQVLHGFVGRNGFQPGGLVFDKAGNLYGTTLEGGTGRGCQYGCGTVFELTRNSDGSWKETVLHNFSGGKDGAYPDASLTFDRAGNLYGAAAQGGDLSCNGGLGCGTVFRLKPSSNGGWTVTVLHRFTGGEDGEGPWGSVIFDASGNLYSATGTGGTHGLGTIFELTPKSGTWEESVLYAFGGGNDGSYPFGGVVFDKAGNLYGVTEAGGSGACGGGGCGTVYKLRPEKKGWRETLLHRFADQTDGFSPMGPPVLDNAGALLGTAYQGGRFGAGTVYQLTPTVKGGWNWKVVYAFSGGGDGNGPYEGGLSIDALGNLYGTTLYGGAANTGTVFRLKQSTGGKWKETVLCAFSGGRDGSEPTAGVVERAGRVYGTTAVGGDQRCNSGVGCGVVFEVIP
jgi:uncharacterized repeat protein (TIGR03803 family)